MPVKHENPILVYIYHAHGRAFKIMGTAVLEPLLSVTVPTSKIGDFANLAMKELTTLMKAET